MAAAAKIFERGGGVFMEQPGFLSRLIPKPRPSRKDSVEPLICANKR
jgi:hypothetical protein